MKIINQEVKLEPLDAVRPHPKNPRQGDIGAIHESITENGFYGVVICQRSTGHILAGNHRWEAARQAGAKEIPVAWLDVDDQTALRILLVDNRANDLAAQDDIELAKVLHEIIAESGTLRGTGYDGDALDELLADLEREGTPFEPETRPEIGTREHDDEDVEKAREKIEGQFDKDQKLRKVLCPECGEEFFLDE